MSARTLTRVLAMVASAGAAGAFAASSCTPFGAVESTTPDAGPEGAAPAVDAGPLDGGGSDAERPRCPPLAGGGGLSDGFEWPPGRGYDAGGWTSAYALQYQVAPLPRLTGGMALGAVAKPTGVADAGGELQGFLRHLLPASQSICIALELNVRDERKFKGPRILGYQNTMALSRGEFHGVEIQIDKDSVRLVQVYRDTDCPQCKDDERTLASSLALGSWHQLDLRIELPMASSKGRIEAAVDGLVTPIDLTVDLAQPMREVRLGALGPEGDIHYDNVEIVP